MNTPLPPKESKAFIKKLKQLKKDTSIDKMTAFASFTGINRTTLGDLFSGKQKATEQMAQKLDQNLWDKLNDLDIYALAIRRFVDCDQSLDKQ